MGVTYLPINAWDWDSRVDITVMTPLTCWRHRTARWLTLNPYRKIHLVNPGYPRCDCRKPELVIVWDEEYRKEFDYERFYRW